MAKNGNTNKAKAVQKEIFLVTKKGQRATRRIEKDKKKEGAGQQKN